MASQQVIKRNTGFISIKGTNILNNDVEKDVKKMARNIGGHLLEKGCETHDPSLEIMIYTSSSIFISLRLMCFYTHKMHF